MAVSFFLPFYNEKRILRENTLAVLDALKKLDMPFELVLVDDGSTDGSSEIAEQLAKTDRIKRIRYDNGPSRRENLAVALKGASFEIVAFADIDLSADINYLHKLIDQIRNGAAVATGSRYMSIKVKRGFYRRMYSGLYNWFLRFYFGSSIHDHQCGFKAFKRTELLILLDEMGYDHSFCRGWFWDAELLIRAQKKHLRISEFPLEWKKSKDSTFRIKREVRMIPYILRFREKMGK